MDYDYPTLPNFASAPDNASDPNYDEFIAKYGHAEDAKISDVLWVANSMLSLAYVFWPVACGVYCLQSVGIYYIYLYIYMYGYVYIYIYLLILPHEGSKRADISYAFLSTHAFLRLKHSFSLFTLYTFFKSDEPPSIDKLDI